MTRPRRDPRALRAAQAIAGDRRPRFDLAMPVGPAQCRPRRDPRAERAGLLVPGSARARLDRTHSSGALHPAAKLAAEPATTSQVVVVDDPARIVLVICDCPAGRLSPHDRQTIGAARQLADRGEGQGAVVLVVGRLGEASGAAGVDRVIAAGGALDDPEGAGKCLAALVRALGPAHVLLPESIDGADRARRLAVLLGEPLFPAVEQISGPAALRSARAATVDQRCASLPRLLSIAADRIAPYSGPLREGRAMAADLAPARPSPILSIEDIAADPATVALEEAGFVISAGAGVTDFAVFHRLAEALAASPGASRVVCDAGQMPRAAQVGASGTVLSAACYIALGISGAPQHLQGIGACPHVIAVNADASAPIMERAGLAIVADAQAVMVALLALIAEEGRE